MKPQAPDYLELESASFLVEGIAQTLHALATSEHASQLGWAFQMLADNADQAVAAIVAASGAALAARKSAPGP